MNYVSGYIGTYTHGSVGRGKGIYKFKLDKTTGAVEDLQLAAASENPAYIAVSPSKKYLYVTNETDIYEGNDSGSVSAFEIEEKSGNLTLLNRKTSNGKHPCHIAINQDASHGVVANYTSGILSVFSLEPNGALGEAVQTIQYTGSGPVQERQECSHAHFFMFDKTNSYGFTCDLGADRVIIYTFNKNASMPLALAPDSIFYFKPGAGPRHGVFHPNGDCGYFVNELDSTVDVLQYNSRGGFEKSQSLSTLPQGITVPNTTAAIKISPNGQFLYASNRGHDSIAVYKVQPNQTLQFVSALSSGGKTPRDFTLDPTGTFLLVCHQDSDNLVVFHIDQSTGLFNKIAEYEVPSGVCIIFL
ncbi:MAG: lactonase family protein [Treponema sp.]|jgi:6-phosphogluconolactonase|nr:lactonase family protein [Treponema sp.]